MKPLLVSVLVALSLFEASAAEPTWLTDLSAAQEQARTEKKLVLIDFTGSDWCGWCIKLNKDVFSKPEFIKYAKENLVLVEVDFPKRKQQSPDQKKANEALQNKYNVQGFPTIIVIDANGKTVWSNEGYLSGGPKAMIDAIESAKKKV